MFTNHQRYTHAVAFQGAQLIGIDAPGAEIVPHIEFDIAELESTPARATRIEAGRYLVKVDASALELLEGFVTELFANQLAFPAIGAPALEIFSEPTMRRVYNRLNDFASEQGRLFHTPRCPIRAGTANDVYFVGVRLLLAHEIVHIQHGHVDLKAAARASGEALTPEQLLGLEYDSDACAMGRLIQQHARTPGQAPEQWVRNLAIGGYVQLMLSDERLEKASEYDYYQHPTPRQVALLDMLSSTLKPYAGIEPSEYVGLIAESVCACEQAREAATGAPSAAQRLKDFHEIGWGNGTTPAIEKAKIGWASVRKRLLPYTYMGLAPEDSEVG